MTDTLPDWTITAAQWQHLAARCAATFDALADGAYVRHDTTADELHFYATPVQKPADWHLPFLETVPGTSVLGAFIGRVWHDSATDIACFEVILYAAAQALRADYESDVSDMDYVTYEQAVDDAVRGTDADQAWLRAQFGRLALLASP